MIDNNEAVPAEAVVVEDLEGVEGGGTDTPEETVASPGKVLRIGSMIKQLLEEVRQAPLDDASRARLRTIFERSVEELAGALSPDLRRELDALALPFTDDEIPSDAELRIAQAQLVGWLEGLFHGIQATLFAEQMAAQSQLEQMRHRQLGPGPMMAPGAEAAGGDGAPRGGGTYL